MCEGSTPTLPFCDAQGSEKRRRSSPMCLLLAVKPHHKVVGQISER
jgi:hypothetical protein